MDSAVLATMKKNGKERQGGQCSEGNEPVNFKVNNPLAFDRQLGPGRP